MKNLQKMVKGGAISACKGPGLRHTSIFTNGSTTRTNRENENGFRSLSQCGLLSTSTRTMVRSSSPIAASHAVTAQASAISLDTGPAPPPPPATAAATAAEAAAEAEQVAHPFTLTSIGNLGLLLQSQGRLYEARPLLEEALVGYRATLGEAHPDTLASVNNLGLLLKDQGRLDEARPLLELALAGPSYLCG